MRELDVDMDMQTVTSWSYVEVRTIPHARCVCGGISYGKSRKYANSYNEKSLRNLNHLIFKLAIEIADFLSAYLFMLCKSPITIGDFDSSVMTDESGSNIIHSS